MASVYGYNTRVLRVMQPLFFAFIISVFLVPVYESSSLRFNVFDPMGWYCWSFRNHGLVSIEYYLWTLYYKAHSFVYVRNPLNISIISYSQMLSPAREFKWPDTDSAFTNVRQAMKEDLLKSASNPHQIQCTNPAIFITD